MLVVIRDGWEELSTKTRYVAQLLRTNLNIKLLHVFRKDKEMFREKWGHNQIELATSTIGILLSYFLKMLKGPEYLRDLPLRRVFHWQRKHLLLDQSYLSVLSQALNQYFGRSARTGNLIDFLKQLNMPKIFLIDEFLSLNSVDLKELRNLGYIIYVSQDLAYNRFGFGDNFIVKNLLYKWERDAIALVDVVIACSERDRLNYIEMGAKKAIFYPNIYPNMKFEPCGKDQVPSISIVIKEHWGSRAHRALNDIFKALSFLNKKIRVYVIGLEPQKVPKNVELLHYKLIPNEFDYLRILGKSWIGINIGIHEGGTNKRKYDSAIAGTVILSDSLGARGELLPYEYTFLDNYDFAAKLKRILEFGKETLTQMGIQNRKETISLAEKQQKKLLEMIKSIEFRSR